MTSGHKISLLGSGLIGMFYTMTLHKFQSRHTVQHVDERGELITQEETLLRLTDGQIPLFDNLFEDLTSRKSYQQDSPTEEEGSNGSL